MLSIVPIHDSTYYFDSNGKIIEMADHIRRKSYREYSISSRYHRYRMYTKDSSGLFQNGEWLVLPIKQGFNLMSSKIVSEEFFVYKMGWKRHVIFDKYGNRKLKYNIYQLIDGNKFIYENENRLFGVKDFNEKDIIKPIYNELRKRSSNYLYFEKDENIGLIDIYGNIKESRHGSVIDILDSNFVIINDEKYGLINQKDSMLIEPTHENFNELWEFYGLHLETKDNKIKEIKNKESDLFPFQKDSSGLYGFKNTNGDVVQDTVFYDIRRLGNQRKAEIEQNKKINYYFALKIIDNSTTEIYLCYLNERKEFNSKLLIKTKYINSGVNGADQYVFETGNNIKCVTKNKTFGWRGDDQDPIRIWGSFQDTEFDENSIAFINILVDSGSGSVHKYYGYINKKGEWIWGPY